MNKIYYVIFIQLQFFYSFNVLYEPTHFIR